MYSEGTKLRAHTVSENLGATSEFPAPEGSHETFCTEDSNSGVTCKRLVFMLNNTHVYVKKKKKNPAVCDRKKKQRAAVPKLVPRDLSTPELIKCHIKFCELKTKFSRNPHPTPLLMQVSELRLPTKVYDLFSKMGQSYHTHRSILI